MAANSPRITELVEHLESELRRSPTLTDEDRHSLEEALTEIQTALKQAPNSEGQPADEPTAETSIGSRLQGSIERFEASHPDLADAINRLLNNLGQIGL